MTHYDKMIEDALDASTSDLKGGASSTGVRAWRKFCAQFGYKALRPLDAMAPLGMKLREERLVMRFIMWLVDSRDILASSAANYLGSVQGWHLRQTGVKAVRRPTACPCGRDRQGAQAPARRPRSARP